MTDGPNLTASLYPPDAEHVPTVIELAARGLARPVISKFYDKAGNPKSDTRYSVSPAGQALIDEAMSRNAERGRAWDARHKAIAAVDADLA